MRRHLHPQLLQKSLELLVEVVEEEQKIRRPPCTVHMGFHKTIATVAQGGTAHGRTTCPTP